MSSNPPLQPKTIFSDTFFQFEKSPILVILSSNVNPATPYFFPDPTLTHLPAGITDVRIYAENIVVTDSVQYPGAKVTLCCNKLSVKEHLKQAVIDVGGVNGAAGSIPDNRSDDNGKKEDGENDKEDDGPHRQQDTAGKPAGDITLYVEDLDISVAERLLLKASGGIGGSGIARTASDKIPGGPGGDGGNGGNIKIYWSTKGAAALPVLHTIIRGKDDSFAKKLFLLKDVVIPTLNDVNEPDLFHIETLDSKINEYILLLNSIAGLAVSLARVTQIGEDGNSSWVELRNEHQEVLTKLTAFSQRTIFPNNPKELILDIRRVVDALERGAGGSRSTENLRDLYKYFTAKLDAQMAAEAGDFEEYLDMEVKENLRGSLLRKRKSLVGICVVDKGRGGDGGLGDPNLANNGRGPRGADGRDGARTVFTPQSESPHPTGTKGDTVLANPDQCQMLLNFADLLYFKGSQEQITLARTLYRRLEGRLSFVLELKKGTDESTLAIEYKKQEEEGIIISPLSQLSQIYATAVEKIQQIALGQDFLNQSPSWAPRLSHTYYNMRIDDVSIELKTMESIYQQHETALKAGRKVLDSIKNSIDNASKLESAADSLIRSITSPSSEMNTTAFTISHFTPLLKEKRKGIQRRMEPLIRDVKLKIDIDPGIFISALSAVVKDPKPTTAAKEGLSLVGGIKESFDKAKVQRQNIVKELREVGDTFESIKEGFSALNNGEMEVDDPGAGKLLIAKASLEKLMKEFKDSLPQDEVDSVMKSVGEFLELVETRNNAVIRYNSILHTLDQAIKSKEYNSSQVQLYSRQLADSTIDPSLPSTLLWLRKSRDEYRYRMLTQLYLSSRALRFWGLRDKDPIDFFSNIRDELPDNAMILEARRSIMDEFDLGLRNYAGNIAETWPPDKWQSGSTGKGLLYKLSPDELQQLLQNAEMREDDLGRKFSVHTLVFKIPPATRNVTSSESVFHGRANVRIDQVRLWLPGATVGPDTVGRRILTAKLTQHGDETIVSSSSEIFSFIHDPIQISFSYFADKVNTHEDISSGNASGRQDILERTYHGIGDPKADTYAPIGPFATWRIEVSERDNADLNFERVKEGFLEFWGSSMPFDN